MNLTRVPAISVLIATRNRAESLRATLEALAHQDTAGAFGFEVIIIDNGSTDTTRHIVEEATRICPAPIVYLYEGGTGKPCALNTGIARARGELLAFTDDDIIVGSKWLAALRGCFRETGTQAVGGRILPLWVDGRPDWLTDRVMRQLGTFGCLDLGLNRIMMNKEDQWWVGGNIAMHRELPARLGGFDERRLRGEDAEIFRRYLRAGVRIMYEPASVVHHKVGKDRLTPEYFRRWHELTGLYRALGLGWKPHHVLTVMPLYGYGEMWRWFIQWLRTNGSGEERWIRLVHECRLRLWWSVWLQRLRLWPRWCLTVLTRRSFLS